MLLNNLPFHHSSAPLTQYSIHAYCLNLVKTRSALL